MKISDWRISGSRVAAGIALLVVGGPAAAQPSPGSWGSGMMMGPGMMGPGGMWDRGMCSPRGAGLAEWRLTRIEERVRPTAEQRTKLTAVREASEKAANIITAACPSEIPQSPVTRLELMEKRLNAMLEAIKLVRPAFNAFYDSLTGEQQARLATIGPRGWGWRGWRWDRSEVR